MAEQQDQTNPDPTPEVEETETQTPGEKDRTPEEPPSAVDAGVPHVTDAAPTDLETDPQSSVVTGGDYEVTPPATMQDQKAPKLEGDAQKRGYYGETAADRAKAAKAEHDAALTVQTNAEAVAAVSDTSTED